MSDNGSPYVSSIIFKYGDTDRVREDVKTLNEILGRQGLSLFIDVIAECVARSALEFKNTNAEVKVATESIVDELREAIGERT